MKRRWLLALLLAAPLAAPLTAQVTVIRWSSAKPLPHGYVDRNTLDLHLEFPVFTRPTVGRAQVHAVLVYDSQFWLGVNGAWTPQSGNGWWLRTNAGQLNETTTQNSGSCGWTTGDGTYTSTGTIITHTFNFAEPDGSYAQAGSYITVIGPSGRHTEGEYDDCPPSDTLPVTFSIEDGKGYRVQVDASGNGTAWDSAGDNLTDGFTDTNGNAVTASGGVYSDPLGTALTITGSGTPASPLVYTYTGGNGQQAHVTENFTTINASANFGCYSGWSGILTVPASLVYADGETYSFSYDGGGQLTQMTLPTGGIITYVNSQWMSQCSPAVSVRSLTRSESLDPGKQWSWSNNTTATQTVETSPDGNNTDFDFDAWGHMTEADQFAGSTELTHTTIAYLYSAGEDVTYTTELVGQNGGPNLYAVHVENHDPSGFLTGSSTTDWGTSSSGGPLLRQTATTYEQVDGAEVPQQTTVKDGGGNVAAQTTLSYDTKANVSAENDYTTAATWLTHSFTYNANGTVATATDANGAVTNYTYGTSGCGLFPTAIASAQIPAIQSSATWSCTGGVPLTTTGANNDTTHIVYNDPLWRPTQVAAPDGGVTNLTYSANSVERAMPFNNGYSTEDMLTTLDGLGRPALQQKRQGPSASNFDTVQTTFDAMDRPLTVSMPYTAAAGGGPPSGTKFTTTYYDALSRVVKVVDGGAGEVDTSYSGNDVLRTVVGTPNVARQQEFDGLGRLKSVCELTSTLAGRGSCGQTTAQTGYWTQYTRTPLGQIAEVVQNAQGSPTETRYYNFDWSGRLNSEVNPESGTTYYYYDGDATCGNGNGDLLRRVDANGNTTCYAHDALHRLTSVTYPSGPNAVATLTKTFDWDTAPGQSPANAVGRLVEAITGAVSSPTTAVAFSYDIAGRTADVYETTPHSGGWYTVGAGYYQNGALASLGFNGLDFTYGADPEGRMGGVTDNVSGKGLETGVTYNPASQVTGLQLGTVDLDKDAWTYDPGTGRMTGYSATIAGTAYSTTLNWNLNGSLAKMQVPGSNSQNCSYTQDDLGRIASVNCGTNEPNLNFAFDPFGNLAVTGSPAGLVTTPVYSNNQLTKNGGVTMTSDADGNLEGDPAIPQDRVNAFDAEGKAVTFENASVVYDALGRAVEVNGSWQYVYGPDGRKLAVMQGQTQVRSDIALPGGDAAVYSGASLAYYRHADWEGSARLSSTPNSTIYSARAFTPYGAVYDESGGSNDRDFTGTKQDIAPGKYDFLYREYEPVMGRWFTPDPAGLAAVDPNNPQTWNRYAYVGGNPLAFVDPLGMQPCNNASLERENKDHQVGGPYSPDEDGAAANPGDCNGGGQTCYLDGTDVGCSLLGDFTAGGEAIGGIAQCAWSDCMGAGSIFDQNDDLRKYKTTWSEQGEPCTPGPGANFCVTVVDRAVTTEIESHTNCGLGPLLCSIFPKFTLAGIVPGEPMPSADGLSAVVKGFASAVHPLEFAAANAAMYFTGAALTVIGYSIGVAGCADPTPFEPLTCVGGIAAGAFAASTGAVDIGIASYFLTQVTIPAFKDW